MKSPLIPIDIISIYKNSLGDLLPLPSRMARCTPDTYKAIFNIATALAKKGGKLILSDLFRSYDMQAQSHQDYISGRKKAFSPPPGGSFHEAGRAFDLDLSAIKIPLSDFWTIAAKFGVYPIINQPKANISEAWHFDCRGSHQIVYQYYADGKGNNFKPYTAAAASGILSIGVNVDAFGNNQVQAAIQSGIIRLGKEIGNIDGHIGHRTQQALEELGVTFDLNNPNSMLVQIENLVQNKFPSEFTMPAV
ncbi:D-alanyl-D-alanine carboxypeptidase-like protein [Chitinophaga dinghuensis]|uniref:D-alanyl-D-alanine carboxypeptidase-like protein n=1 Tax=Chitinophaga dinghuensis TaxID=1539050 RepID=A0A327VNZ8_9BACT|nr:D-alanyl-D-alanine carboxypeptidase family protein [Chitinophaga dinghuensis]RAJ76823.1 D-alanyl-D-alanine carboxypeptidase-like protein [Chitinophaga dinghuensis]